ncbi:MAG: hypothetical protein WBX15_01620 [Thermoanaerobaculia bacterium]
MIEPFRTGADVFATGMAQFRPERDIPSIDHPDPRTISRLQPGIRFAGTPLTSTRCVPPLFHPSCRIFSFSGLALDLPRPIYRAGTKTPSDWRGIERRERNGVLVFSKVGRGE